MYWNEIAKLSLIKSKVLNQQHIMYWNKLILNSTFRILILNQQHIMYWNYLPVCQSHASCVEPTTYNVLKLLGKPKHICEKELNQQHIMYWNITEASFLAFAILEPTTYNVLKLNFRQILIFLSYFEPTTYNVLKLLWANYFTKYYFLNQQHIMYWNIT